VRFVDSHLHLDGPGAQSAISLARASGILLLGCGVDRETSEEVVRLASEDQALRGFVGVHPSEVLKEPDLKWFPRALERAAGVGEIGLDPKYSPCGAGSPQMKALVAQLQGAKRAGKPVQVHSRGAERECLGALEASGLRSVLMHWFQDEGNLGRVVDRGYFVSFGPSLLYSKKLQRMAASCDHSQVLTETDFPVPFAPLGGVCGPSLVPSVVFKLAEVWGEPFGEVRKTVSRNAARFLGEPEKG